MKNWKINSWRNYPAKHIPEYPDQKNFNGKTPSYISIDTEGSEYQILSTFDFSKFRPVFFTVEHNFTNQQEKIDKLMLSNNYVRILKNITTFDGWYVSAEALTQIKDNIY